MEAVKPNALGNKGELRFSRTELEFISKRIPELARMLRRLAQTVNSLVPQEIPADSALALVEYHGLVSLREPSLAGSALRLGLDTGIVQQRIVAAWIALRKAGVPLGGE